MYISKKYYKSKVKDEFYKLEHIMINNYNPSFKCNHNFVMILMRDVYNGWYKKLSRIFNRINILN